MCSSDLFPSHDMEDESKNNRQTVTEENVAEVVSMMTGVPVQKVNQSENKKLANMSNELMGKVIGQDDAVKKIVKAISFGSGSLCS